MFLLTEMTTISISVVVLASLIFLDSLDSPLITLTFRLELSNLARFFSASLIARKSRKFKITKEMQGIQWTNRMRNLKRQKSIFHSVSSRGLGKGWTVWWSRILRSFLYSVLACIWVPNAPLYTHTPKIVVQCGREPRDPIDTIWQCCKNTCQNPSSKS